MRRGRAAVMLPLLAWVLAAAGGAAAAVTFHEDPADSTLWFGSARIAIHLDRWMNYEVISIAAGESLSVTAPLPGGPGTAPPFSLTSGSTEIGEFVIAPGAAGVRLDPVASPQLGSGLRLTLTGSSSWLSLSRVLEFEIYEDHDDAAITRARYVNEESTTLLITRMRDNRLRLDLRRADPARAPYGFLAVQPTIDSWGQNWIGVALAPGYQRTNPLLGGAVNGRGGTPFMDLWGPSTGLALVSVEPTPTALEFPCRVLGDGRVEIAIEVEPPRSHGQFPATLAPGDTLVGPRTAIIAHRGDFHDAAFRYGRLLDAALAESGRDTVGPYPESAWTPYWKTWGLGREFTTADVFARLDGLASLGFARIGLDDGWFDTYGGWYPDREKFPAGESDLKAFIAALHARDFEVMLWWNPTGWEPASGLGSWLLVRDSGGGYPVDPRGRPYLCPAYPPAVAAIVAMVDRFMGSWEVDALYMDGESLVAVPPCYNPMHAHARAAASCEALPDLYRVIRDHARAWRPEGTLILCECSEPHDPYKMPYYDQEDASDPMSDRMVRWKVKFARAFRGGRAPVGDGYVDPFPGSEVSGTFANGLGVGAVLTSMYVTPDDLGSGMWAQWSALNATSGASRATTRNLYTLGFEFPEAHVLAWEDGSLLFSFMSEVDWTSPVTLRGLDPGSRYEITELDTGLSRGMVTGPAATISVPFHRQSADMPWWILLKATPEAAMTSVEEIGVGSSASGPPGAAFTVYPTPGRGPMTFLLRQPGARLTLFDLGGRRVREFPASRALADEIHWDGTDERGRPVASGLYVARLSWVGGEMVRRVVVAR